MTWQEALSTSTAVSSATLQVGYKQLKHKQNEAVKEFVSGRDVFVSLPMGSNKSLCYAVLPAAVNAKSPLRTTLWQVFETDSAVLFLAHSPGMAVYMYGLLTHMVTRRNCLICQNSTIITFH